MLDRLVRRPILAEPDRIMREDIDRMSARERGDADGGAARIGEDQEAAAGRDDAAVQRHAVHRRDHAVLADAVMHVAAGKILRCDVLERLHLGVVRRGEIRRADHELRHVRNDGLERRLARFARRDRRLLGGELALELVEGLMQRGERPAGKTPLEFGALLRIGRAEALLPRFAGCGAAPPGLAPGVEDLTWHLEGRRGPAEVLLGARGFLGPERLALSRSWARTWWRAAAARGLGR